MGAELKFGTYKTGVVGLHPARVKAAQAGMPVLLKLVGGDFAEVGYGRKLL